MTNPIFFGLSTIIHLLVIAWNALVLFVFPNSKRQRIMRQRAATKALSAMYVTAVFAFVAFCGSTILYASATEKHSSIRAIEDAVSNATNSNAAGFSEPIATAFPAPTAPNLNAQSVALYVLLFALLVMVFVFTVTNPAAAATFIGTVQRKLDFRPIVVSVGISMFLIGTLSAFLYLTPVTTAASYLLGTLRYVDTFAR